MPSSPRLKYLTAAQVLVHCSAPAPGRASGVANDQRRQKRNDPARVGVPGRGQPRAAATSQGAEQRDKRRPAMAVPGQQRAGPPLQRAKGSLDPAHLRRPRHRHPSTDREAARAGGMSPGLAGPHSPRLCPGRIRPANPTAGKGGQLDPPADPRSPPRSTGTHRGHSIARGRRGAAFVPAEPG